MTVINPKSRVMTDLYDKRERWRRLGTQLNHLITEDDYGLLPTEGVANLPDTEQAREGCEVDEWWVRCILVERSCS